MPTNPSLSVGLVFDDSLDSPDGVAQHVKTLGAWLSGQGHQVSYLVGQTKLTEWSGGRVFSLAKNQKVTFNGNRLSIPLPASGQKIKKILNENDFDVLHVMVPYSPFMAQKIINRAAAHTAILGTFHIYPSGPLAIWGSRALRLLYGASLDKFSYMASVSPAAADFAKKSFGLDSQVVPNPVNLAHFKPAEPARHRPGRIVFLGRLVKRKGAKQLLQAFALSSQNYPTARLVIAGAGRQADELAVLAKKLDISQKTQFRGFIAEDQKPELLASAEIACFPSLYGESFGIVLVEAMAAGAQVVIGGKNPGYESVLGGMPELLVDPINTVSFAERLNDLLGDQSRREKLHSWQQKQLHNYDIETIGPRLESEYRSAIARLAKNGHNKAHE